MLIKRKVGSSYFEHCMSKVRKHEESQKSEMSEEDDELDQVLQQPTHRLSQSEVSQLFRHIKGDKTRYM